MKAHRAHRLATRSTGAPSVVPPGYERIQALSGRRPVQPRSLTFAEQRDQATRPDLWPQFLPPPELAAPAPTDGPDEVVDLDDLLEEAGL